MKTLLWLVPLIIVFMFLVRYVERHSIFFPMKKIIVTPSFVELPHEDIYFNTRDNKRLNAWFIPHEKAEFTVIFCHGNAGNISHRLEKILLFHEIKLNTFIFDYRGYGKSEGSPSESGVYEDARAAYNYLTEERALPKDRIVLYGESIGGAVAIDLAQKVNVRALISEETLTSTKDIARIAYPFIPPVLFSNKFDSVSRIKNVTCPKLIIHSVDDEIVPFHLGERLFSAARSPKKFLKIQGAHNTAFLDSKDQFMQGISSFLSTL